MNRTLRTVAALALPLLCLASACTDLTGRGPAHLDYTVSDKVEEHPRIGRVYCMRGWLGIFSTGMDALANEIDTQLGAAAVSVANEEHMRLREFLVDQYKQGKLNEPLVLLGHSYGADDQIRVAKTLKENGISVDLIVLIDPVTPPDVPDNVNRCYCVYMSHPLTDWYPAWRGVPATVANPKKTTLTNIDLRYASVDFDTNVHHALIDKVPGIHRMVMDEIAKVCPPRPGITQLPWPPLTGPLSTTHSYPSQPVQMPATMPKPAATPSKVTPVAAPATPRAPDATAVTPN